MIAGQNFSLESSESCTVVITVASIVLASVSSATWVCVPSTMNNVVPAPVIKKTTALSTITLSATQDTTGTIATFSLLGTDTAGLDDAMPHELWYYDAAGHGKVVAKGTLTVTPNLLGT